MHPSHPFRESNHAALLGHRVSITKGALAGFTGSIVRNEPSSRWLVKLDVWGEGLYCLLHEDMLTLLPDEDFQVGSE